MSKLYIPHYHSILVIRQCNEVTVITPPEQAFSKNRQSIKWLTLQQSLILSMHVETLERRESLLIKKPAAERGLSEWPSAVTYQGFTKNRADTLKKNREALVLPVFFFELLVTVALLVTLCRRETQLNIKALSKQQIHAMKENVTELVGQFV